MEEKDSNHTKGKILLASPLPPPYSGYETITEYLLRSKITKEFDVIHLDTSNRRSNSERGRFDILNSLQTLKLTMNLFRLLIIHRPQIANIPIARNKAGFLKWSVLIWIASVFRTDIVSRLGGEDFDKFYGASSSLMKKYIRFILKQISTVIVRAQRLKSQFDGLVPEEKIRVVYLPIDTAEFRDISDKPNGKVPRGEIKVLYVSHISKAKGALDLLKAIPIVVNQVSDIKFLFAGDIIKVERNILHIGNPPDILREIDSIIEKYKIRHYIEFLGLVVGQNKISTFLDADIFVFPSYSEGFPFVVLEAMAAGLPIVATPVGALPEVFKDGENVLFADRGNPQDIAEKILMLIRNPALREKMIAINHKNIEKRFNMDRFADQMLNVFKELPKIKRA